MKHGSRLITLYAAALLAFGVALLFAPETFGTAVDQSSPSQAFFAQLLGAAFIGFAASNWLVRRAPVGGIYGRAVVAGNQAFSLVGALVLLGSFPEEPSPGFWLLLGVLALGAVLHGGLLFRGPAFGEPSERA